MSGLVTPHVRMIAATQVFRDQVDEYLTDIGFPQWVPQRDKHEDADLLTEFAGRLCYASWEPGYNKNVTRIRADLNDYMDNIRHSGHGNVMEHAYCTFLVDNVSRVFTHELVRHRVGCSTSQESQRYVRLDNIELVTSAEFDAEDNARILSIAESVQSFADDTAAKYALDDSAAGFAHKKRITSAIRRALVEGVATRLVWTANLRTIRYVAMLRTSPAAEEEMRGVFQVIGQLAKDYAPAAFRDMKLVDGAWSAMSGRV